MRPFYFFLLIIAFSLPLFAEDNVPTYKLSLKQSETMALNYSYALKAAEMGKDVTAGKIMSAYSGVLPKISGSFNKTYSDTYLEKRAGSSRDKWNELYSSSITVNQSIYNGGKNIATIREAKYSRKVATENIRQQEQQIRFLIRENYYRILLNKEMVKVALKQVELSNKYLDDVKKRKNLETATNYDVLRAEVESTNESTALTEAESELGKAKNSFSRMLGLPANSKLILTEKLAFIERTTPKIEELYQKALSYRPELRKSNYNIKIQQEKISETKAELLPHLSASGSFSGTTDSFDRSTNKYDKSWEVGLTLSLNIFDGLLHRGKIKELKAGKEKLTYLHSELKEEIKLEIKNTILDINSAATKLKAQQRNVEQATESLRLTIARERQGVSTHLDVLTARQTLGIAQRNFYRSIYLYKNAWNKLTLIIGENQINK